MKENKIAPQPLIFFRQDPHGVILNDFDPKIIKSPSLEVIEDVKDTFNRYLGDRLHSIYYHVNQATLKNPKEIREFLFLVLLNQKASFTKDKEYMAYIKSKFPFVDKLNIDFLTHESLLALEYYQFSIKTMYSFVYGKNVIPELPKFKPEFRIAYSLFIFSKSIDNWIKKLNHYHWDKNYIKKLSSQIALTLLLVGFETCIEKEKKYTRDPYTCYRVFSKYYPDKEPFMRKVYFLYKEPTTNFEDVSNLITGFGQWLHLLVRLQYMNYQLNNP